MKKNLCFGCLVFACSFTSAQVTVNPNGNVSVKSEVIPLSPLSVNSAGNPVSEIYVESNKKGFVARREGVITIDWGIAVTGDAVPAASTFNLGIRGYAVSKYPIGSGRAYGVYGRAGNCTSGYNYGVFGAIDGSENGAGIYGTSDISGAKDDVPGRYAGFFRGNVRVTGSIYAQVLIPTATSQQSLSPLSRVSATGVSVTDKLGQLNTVQYNLERPNAQKASMTRSVGDSLETTSSELSVEEAQTYSKTHYGFVAQELKEVYPDLVYENAQGELSINYIEMIPLLVQSIQELTMEVNSLKTDKGLTRAAAPKGEDGSLSEYIDTMIPELFQNTPNPFTENTEIGYAIPEDAKSATLYIYDMNGKQVDEVALSQRGKGTVTLQGSRLEAGIYLYSLIIDGKLIDVKRMVLTK